MRSVIFTQSPTILAAVAEKFNLSESAKKSAGVTEAFEGSTIAAVLCENPAEALSGAFKTFGAERGYLAAFAHSVSDERHLGDIVLPNAFFTLDPALAGAEVTKDNRDAFAKDPVFLENYETQGDYDFGEFGFSVGGTCVSGAVASDSELLAKIHASYAADAYDADSYAFVREAAKLFPEGAYAVLGLADGNTDPRGADDIPEAVLGGRVASIIAFLEGSFDGDSSDSEEEDEDVDSDTETDTMGED
jgi:hypothetical protein